MFGQNEAWRFIAVFGVLLISLIIGRIARLLLERRGKMLQERPGMEAMGLTFVYIGKPVVLLAFAGGFAGSMLFLYIPAALQPAVDLCNRLLFSLSVAYMVYNMVDIIDHYLGRWAAKTENKIDDMLVPLVRKSLRITIIIVVTVYIAESISGKTIGTLVAGLGIGGLAVALAAQDTLKNFFASIVIMIDQPFQIGDRVKINGIDGPIEEVGFRSTKIRTLDGHLVTIPNSEVANLAVENIGKRPYIRKKTHITITYDTAPEQVEVAVAILKTILDERKERLDPENPARVSFDEFDNCSLNILMIYWFTPPEYWDFQAFNNEVNMEILKRFNVAGIEFAFPTQTLYLANDDKRQLGVKQL